MYELSIAAKYLTPRWRNLSVSIISLISVLVISVVVWLIVVFFSVTNGLTNGWLDKLTALTAPVRVTPTKEYYNSYYYLADGISSNSDYTLKTIGEKLAAPLSDPYEAGQDEELPSTWKQPDRLADGTLVDPVKLAFAAIENLPGIPGIKASEHETTVGNVHLRLWHPQQKELPSSLAKEPAQGQLSQASYFGSLDPSNPWLNKAVLAPSMTDLSNVLRRLSYISDNLDSGDSTAPAQATPTIIRKRLGAFLAHVQIDQLKTPDAGWQLPVELLPSKVTWDVIALKRGETIDRLIILPDVKAHTNLQKIKHWEGYTLQAAKFSVDGGDYHLQIHGQSPIELKKLPKLIIPGGMPISAALISGSLDRAKGASDLLFRAHFLIQDIPIEGIIRYDTLQIAHAQYQTQFTSPPLQLPFWAYTTKNSDDKFAYNLPVQPLYGEGVLLPRGFRDAGALLGDTGYISYHAASPSGIHEQQIPIFVSGFYDPGIIPIGGKFILASQNITSQIRAAYSQEETLAGNGINVRFDDRAQAEQVKAELLKAFEDAGIGQYWKVETYREFEFTRDVIQQLQSDKHLFSLLAALIIIVACSNIISMLIILVNDKKNEIGILRSMGASSLSMAVIFGSCGIIMGVVGSLTGTLAAFITLKNLQPLVQFISWIQGYEMFNPLFYGENLPAELSFETLTFVIGATAAISLLSGIIPAIKACLLKPSAILKAE